MRRLSLAIAPRPRAPAVLHLAHLAKALPRRLERLVHNTLRQRQTPRLFRRRALTVRLLLRRGGRGGRFLGGGAGGGVGAHVVEDAADELGVGGDLAGAEEVQGVGLDLGGPVGGVGV